MSTLFQSPPLPKENIILKLECWLFLRLKLLNQNYFVVLKKAFIVLLFVSRLPCPTTFFRELLHILFQLIISVAVFYVLYTSSTSVLTFLHCPISFSPQSTQSELILFCGLLSNILPYFLWLFPFFHFLSKPNSYLHVFCYFSQFFIVH